MIQRSHSAWAANCVVVMKKDGTARVCQDFRELNGSMITHSGGLDDIGSIFDGMRVPPCFQFHRSSFRVHATRNTRGGQAQDSLPRVVVEFSRCGFGLQTIPSGLAAYIRGRGSRPVKREGCR